VKCHPTAVIFFVGCRFRPHQMAVNENVEKPVSGRLTENVQLQVELCEIPLCRRSCSQDGSFRNWGPARRVGSPSEARTNPEE